MKKVYIFIILFCIISILRVLIIDLYCETVYKEENKKIIGRITYIKKDDEKIIIDIKDKFKYRVTTYNKVNYELGDKVSISGLFYTPNDNTVFNLFNYRKYLLSKRIKMISYDCSIKLVAKNQNVLYKIKNLMINHMEKLKTRRYLKAFLIGYTDEIDENIKDNYSSIGISHLFSISGMHVSLFTMLLSIILKKFKYKYYIIILFLLFFVFITDFSNTLLRCILFMGLKFINKIFSMQISNTLLLILVACLLLFFNPYLIYSVGFLFSIIITFFILLSNKYLSKKDYFSKLFILSVICFLSSIPILAFNFFKINFLSVLYNLIFVPFVSFIIFPLSLITFIFPFLDDFYLIFINILENMSIILANINFLEFTISKPNIIFFLLYYLFLYLAIKKNLKFISIFILMLIININSRLMIINTEVIYMDVGQGDCSIVIMPQGKTIVIDTGGNAYKENLIAENKIITYLNSKGIDKIELLILTHGDYDHMGESINLVEKIKVENVIFNCGEFNELEQDLIKVLEKKNIPYYSCIKELNIDDNKLYFLNNKDYVNENDNSSVIYTKLNNNKFLFMGDVGVEVEQDLIEKYNLQDIDVLKVGHHGSKTSSSKDFINETNPKYSIISVGKNNRYGHPNKDVLNNFDNSKIYRTDKDGSIMFKIKNDKFKIETCSP